MKEIKFWLKRVEPLEYYEVDHKSRVGYAYTMKEPSSHYLWYERTIDDQDNPIDEFGKFLARFYKYPEEVGIVVYFHNLKLVYNKEKRLSRIEMFKYE